MQSKPRKRENRTDVHSVYYYKGKPYKIANKTKIKIDGRWVPCVVYKCLYKNPDGLYWVRLKDEFFSLFTTNKPDKDDWIEM